MLKNSKQKLLEEKGHIAKKKFPCKKNKGEHVYILVKPTWGFLNVDDSVSVEDYYKLEDAKDKETFRHKFFLNWRSIECSVCGKKSNTTKDKLGKYIF